MELFNTLEAKRKMIDKNLVDKGKSIATGFIDKEKMEAIELSKILSKLNPNAKEFIPRQHKGHVHKCYKNCSRSYNSGSNRKENNNNINHDKKKNPRMSKAQFQEKIKKTVFVSDIDQQISENDIVSLFTRYGKIVDFRICGGHSSTLRAAFVEFSAEASAIASLSITGANHGCHTPFKVSSSKTAILPINPSYLPHTNDEKEKISRTIYCTNISKKINEKDIKNFFDAKCGKVLQVKLFPSCNNCTNSCFLEFELAEYAMMALRCNGEFLLNMRIRINLSKAPIRNRCDP